MKVPRVPPGPVPGEGDGARDTAASLAAVLSATERAKAGTRAQMRASVTRVLDHLAAWDPSVRERISSADDLNREVDLRIALIDRLVADLVNKILHAPPFQALEASWRGLYALVEWRSEVCETDEIDIVVRVLAITRREVDRDVQQAVEFDQGHLFRKVYEEEFGMAGGRPYGVILADFELAATPVDMAIAERLAEVGAAALCPIIAGAHPSYFECQSFGDIARLRDLETVLGTSSWYARWSRFRRSDDSRYLALTLPRLLVRHPYEADGTGAWGFRFEETRIEQTAGDGAEAEGERDAHLFGTAVYAYGAVLMRAFAETSWFADIRGTRVDDEGGGVVPSPVISSFTTDAPGVAEKFATDAFLTPRVESQLNELGFLPLNRCWLTNRMAFHGSQTVQDPAVYSASVPTANARIMALLQYVLCASRFGHYIKVIARDMVGSFRTAGECERFLTKWLHDYTANIDHLPEESRAKTPLREASVSVRDDESQPGTYSVVVHLRPHYQADELVSSLRLVTKLDSGRA